MSEQDKGLFWEDRNGRFRELLERTRPLPAHPLIDEYTSTPAAVAAV